MSPDFFTKRLFGCHCAQRCPAFSYSPVCKRPRSIFAVIMRIRISLALVTALALSAAGDDVAPRLAGRAFSDTPLLQDLHELCDGIGGRPTGSPACNRAIEWAAAKFKTAGADRVAVETFSRPRLGLGGSAEGGDVRPGRLRAA